MSEGWLRALAAAGPGEAALVLLLARRGLRRVERDEQLGFAGEA